MNFESISKCSRVCARTGRSLHVGETCFSALQEEEDGQIVRADYAAESWPPPPEIKVIGWWRFLIPEESGKRVRFAPNDILLELFDKWLFEPTRSEELYILTLLLLRRRVFRYEGGSSSPDEKKLMMVYSPRREMTYSIPIVSLSEERIAVIQQELAELLYSGVSPEDVEGVGGPCSEMEEARELYTDVQ